MRRAVAWFPGSGKPGRVTDADRAQQVDCTMKRALPGCRAAVAVFGAATLSLLLPAATAESAQEPIEPTEMHWSRQWQTLGAQTVPEWFQDAKLGVYVHWGVYTVPERFSEWYPRFMFDTNSEAYKFHAETYGDPTVFPYHKLVPLFTAEKFNAVEWADIYKSSGARFGGLVTEHHDGFAMWASKLTPWNAGDRGPKRDIVGEMGRELKSRGLKFITTFHHARNLQRNAGPDNGGGYDSHYIYEKRFATASDDPELQKLYGNVNPSDFYAVWFGKLKEVIDNYDPDIVWFDSWLNLIPETDRIKFCRYYLDESKRRGKETLIVCKQNDLPGSVAVNDIEQGGHMEINWKPWMTDDTICYKSWSYVEGDESKPTAMVLHSLIDVVSKNGVLMLNIAPRADGSIPEDQKICLREMGEWLATYGEAIYGTRPWLVPGSGPTMPQPGAHGGMSTVNHYTPEDYRFTMAKDGSAIYLIVLGRPAVGSVLNMKSFAPHRYPPPRPVAKVVELSSGKAVPMELRDDRYVLHYPELQYNGMANVFKIILK